jgi:hypothetical protein
MLLEPVRTQGRRLREGSFEQLTQVRLGFAHARLVAKSMIPA